MEIELAQLRSLIGREVFYRGSPCSIVEVLEDGPALVLEDAGSNRTQQDTQFGAPRREVPVTHTVPVLRGDGQPHEEFMALEFTRR